QINLPKNAKNIGAIVTVNLVSGKKLTDFLIIGEGLASDQTSVLHFGLGKGNVIKNITIKRIDGAVQTIENPKLNEIITIKTK
ncbi:MAG: hypothetical protein COZ74_11685, partial [Flavobacteriaceae bacterium CG_4_8_14_3_um_filter_31_8]